MSKATEQKLSDLHGLVADVLLAQLRGEWVSPQMISQAVKFLKDNGIEAGPENDAMNDLASKVQQFAEDLDENYA